MPGIGFVPMAGKAFINYVIKHFREADGFGAVFP